MKLSKEEQELLDGILLDTVTIGSHHCEDVFNIDSGTTEVATIPTVKHETVKCEIYDDKDSEIDEQYQEIHDAAMTAYESITADVQQIEPKYRARVSEVAAAFLNTALSAVKEKAAHKHKKDQHVSNVKKIEKGDTPVTINMSMGDLIKQKKLEKGNIAANIATPVTVQDDNDIEDGVIVEDDLPPTRKMKTSK